MNIIDLQENLKDVSDNELMKTYNTGGAPQFLVLSELQRRKRMRDDFKRQEAADMPTVAEEMITGAGVPQEGIMAMAGAMAPKTNVAQDTGLAQAMPMQATRAPQQPQMAADGGIMRLNQGSALSLEDLRALKEYRRRLDVDDPNTITSIAAENPFNPMAQYSTAKFGNVDLMQIASMLQRGANRDGLVANFGADAVREAESILSDHSYLNIGQLPLGMGGQFGTISKRKLRQRPIKSYRDPSQSTYLGGERVNQSTDKAPTIDYTDPQSLQEIDPDLDDFLPEIVGGAVDSPINRPFVDTSRIYDGFKPFDSVPEMALDTPLSLRQIIDSGVGTRGADTDPAQQLAEFLASRRSDLPGVNLPGESYPYEIDPDAAEKQGQAILDSLTPPPTGQQNNPNIDGPLSSALQYYGGTAFKGAATPEPTDEERRIIESMSAVPEAGAKIETESAPDRSIDRQINPEKYMDLDDFLAQDSIRDRSSDRGSSLQYPTFLPYPTASGAFPNDAELAGQYPQRGGSETVTERQLRKGQEFADSYRLPPPLREFIDSFKSESIAPKADEDRRDDPELAITEPTTIAEDAETSAEEAMRLQEESFNQPDTVTDGGEGGAGFGSPESEIAKLLSDRRKRADQNKWLALAEAGFAMMGPAATFGEGIGKGGKAGLAALRESQKGLDAFETDMLKLQASMDIADARNQTTIQAAQIRGDNALAAAMLRKKNPTITASALTAAQARVNEARDVLANATTQADKVAADAALKEAIALRDEFTRMYSGQIGANIASNTAGTTGGIKDVDLTT